MSSAMMTTDAQLESVLCGIHHSRPYFLLVVQHLLGELRQSRLDRRRSNSTASESSDPTPSTPPTPAPIVSQVNDRPVMALIPDSCELA
jgi:hypothetical protein